MARMSAALHEVAALLPRLAFGANPGALRMAYYVPKDLPARSPLVVVLHGANQTAAAYASGAGWLTLADRLGFALLCPEQSRANNPLLCFNWFAHADTQRGQGEAASIHQMVMTMLRDHDLSDDHVFITGLSAGAAMTAVMLATYPETFTAGAMIAGLPYGAASNMWEAAYAMSFGSGLTSKELGENVRGASPGGSWPRISVWHGSRDSTVSPEAGDNLVQQWTNVHAVEGHASSAMTQDGREYSVWFDAHGRRKVEHHVIAGMTHGTPLNTRGPAACGTVGPYLLEIGISSSLEIASDWLAPVDC